MRFKRRAIAPGFYLWQSFFLFSKKPNMNIKKQGNKLPCFFIAGLRQNQLLLIFPAAIIDFIKSQNYFKTYCTVL